MCTFSAFKLPFNKATGRQIDIKHDKAETLGSMPLSMGRDEMLPPSRRSSLELTSIVSEESLETDSHTHRLGLVYVNFLKFLMTLKAKRK